MTSSGLEGVVAAETVLTHVDGAKGIWWLRGHGLAELIAGHGYEGAVALLWEGFAGSGFNREQMRGALGRGRTLAFARLPLWVDAARGRPLVEGTRLALAALAEESEPAAIAAALAVAVPALLRLRAGAAPIAPDPSLCTAADVLRMMRGTPAPPALAAALDAYLTTVIDNGLAASTFAARVIA
jgi:citrate synthase